MKLRLNCSSRVIRVSLNGGLGNQLFQICAGIEFALSNSYSLVLRPLNRKVVQRTNAIGLEIDREYRVYIEKGKLKFSPQDKIHVCKFIKYKESKFTYSKIPIIDDHLEITGYFQSSKYFKIFKNEIREFFLDALRSIPDLNKVDNLIQVRLGDMARNSEIRRIHGIISDEYLRKSLLYFGLDYSDFSYITNDVESLYMELPKLSLSGSKFLNGGSDIKDLVYMIGSKNLIISNSTFGWWGAWLSEANVVAPKAWFTAIGEKMYSTEDIFETTWIKM